MKTVDNNDKKTNRKAIIGVIAAISCILVLAVSTVLLNHNVKGDDADNTVNENVEDVVKKDEQVDVNIDMKVDDNDVETPQQPEEPEEPVDWFNIPIIYTTAESDDKSLIELVKNTIVSSNAQLNYAHEVGEGDRAFKIMEAVENANFGGKLEDKFESLDDSFVLVDHDDWTFLDVAGCVGNIMIHEGDLQNDELVRNDILKWLVAKGVYRFELDDESFTSVNRVEGVEFLDENFGHLDVNFVVSFEHEGKSWAALIGKKDELYRVFDIVEEGDIYAVMKEKEKDVAKDDNKKGGKKEQKDPYEGMPGYEGEKEGYHYSPALGYVPIVEGSGQRGEAIREDELSGIIIGDM